jgi:murein L,D-transpeptidase YcbB/YkuD
MRRVHGAGAAAILVVWVAALQAAACSGTEPAASAAATARPPDVASPPAEAVPAQSAADTATAAAEVKAALRSTLAGGHHPWLTWSEFPYLRPAMEELYAAEADGLLWFENGQPIAALQGAIEALGHAGAHGLKPSDYDAEVLASRAAQYRAAQPRGEQLAHFDLAVSITTARLLASVHEGRVDPRIVGFNYDVTPRRLDVKQALTRARSEGVPAALAAVVPTFPVYARLVTALRQYRALQEAGEPARVPALTTQKRIAAGASWDGLPALAARLSVVGDLPAGADASTGTAYTGALVDAVKRFQERHAIEADGVIGPDTIAALNVPLADRVRQIELALERERWLPDTRSQRLIFVNVPLFRLWAYDPAVENEPLRMNVVVGKSLGHATPLFVEQMEYVVFSPFWNPPPSIVRSEIVPHARRDAGYLARQNMEIVASGAADAPSLPATPENLDLVLKGKLTIRQRPGPKNSLGQAKFIFPNADNVYMHGTPAQQLFSRARRDFSHGCIRLEEPPRLASWVLADHPEWTTDTIAAAMAGGTPVQVNLAKPLKVVIFYDTAYVDSHGVVHFADDYYGHDAKLAAAIAKGYPYPRAL